MYTANQNGCLSLNRSYIIRTKTEMPFKDREKPHQMEKWYPSDPSCHKKQLV